MSLLRKVFGRGRSEQDLFAEDVLREFRSHGVNDLALDAPAFALTSPERLINLGNVFQAWRSAASDERGALIGRFVRGALATQPTIASFADIRDSVRAVIRPSSDDTTYCLDRWAGLPEDDQAIRPASKTFASDLSVGLVVDSTDTMVRLTVGHLATLGMAFDDILAIAVKNLEQAVAPISFHELRSGHRVYFSSDAQDYQSSLLLLPLESHFRLPVIDGDPVVLVPGRNQMFLTGSYDTSGLIALADLAGASLNDVAHRCSGMLLRHDGVTWRSFTPPEGPARVAAENVQRLWLGRAYAEQKQALDRLIAARRRDVYVAGQQLYERSGVNTSYATWVEGVADGLLPQADRIAFVTSNQPKQMIDVAWDDAHSIVGGLMDAYGELSPPRYRVREFPNATQWQELMALGTWSKVS